MTGEGTLLLTRSQVAELLTLGECLAAVEEAFRLHGEGRTAPPGVLGLHAADGGFHIKAALLQQERAYFAAKANANFPENRSRFGLPTIQGVIVLSDAENGKPLAVMDSIEITIQRTGAATAVAARRLARPDSQVVTIAGCGSQGAVQLRSLALVLPIRRALAYDLDPARAEPFARDLSSELKIDIRPVTDLPAATLQSDVIVTCTTSTRFVLRREHVRPGTFVAAVGADNEHKQELHPDLLAGGKVVADIRDQAAAIGDCHHAIAAGVLTPAGIYAELGEIVAGRKPGRTSRDEITIFDSTGTALQDVAAAAAVYREAVRRGAGTRVDFAA